MKTVSVKHDPNLQLTTQQVKICDTIQYPGVFKEILPGIKCLKQIRSRRPIVRPNLDGTREEILKHRIISISYPKRVIGHTVNGIIPLWSLITKTYVLVL
jgi:hypothetical protein